MFDLEALARLEAALKALEARKVREVTDSRQHDRRGPGADGEAAPALPGGRHGLPCRCDQMEAAARAAGNSELLDRLRGGLSARAA